MATVHGKSVYPKDRDDGGMKQRDQQCWYCNRHRLLLPNRNEGAQQTKPSCTSQAAS